VSSSANLLTRSRDLSTSARLGTVVAVGGVALAVAFLAYHRADLERSLLGLAGMYSFVSSRGITRLSEVAASAAGTGVAALIVLAWYGAGDLLLGRWAHRDSRVVVDVLSVARAVAYGAGLWSLVWFLLGLAGLYTTLTAVIVLTVGVALGTRALLRCRVAAPSAGVADADGHVTLVTSMLVVALVTAFIAALAPPTAKDALQYHIALPKAFAESRALVAIPYNIASYFPLGVEMHGLWAMLVGRGLGARVGEAAFGTVIFAFFPILLAVVYGWARRLTVPRPWALAGTAIVASVPTVYDVAASGYVDLALAVYVALGVEAAACWWRRPATQHLVKAALSMGFALAVKVLALFSLLLVAMLLLLRVFALTSGERHRLAGRAVVALAAAVALGAAWYFRTWAATGSPIFPFFLDLWPASVEGWDVKRSIMLGAFNAQYGPANPVLSLLTPVLVSLTGWREEPALYEGVLGPTFLVGILLVIWALRRRLLDAELVIAATAGIAIVAWWALTAPVLRYLLPALGPLAVAIAGAAASLSRTGVPRLMPALMAPTAASLLVALSWFVADAPMLPVIGSEPREEYLGRRLDYYPYYRLVNETLPADARIWLINMRRDTYYLQRSYFSDYLFEDHTLRRWVQTSASPAALRAKAREAGITHILVRHDVLLDYNQSSLVDDARSRAENLARLELVRSFFIDGTTILRADAKFLLATLPRS
jgi:hypothetical protein